MRLSPTGLIEISDEDVDKFKKFMKKESHSKRKFHLQHLRMGIDETDNEITIVDHHIIPRWLIREKLIDLCSTPNDTDLKNILESYLNDARNERLRKIIEIEITEQLSHGGQIIYMSFICNPKNLVFGPLRELRSHDRNGGIDLELLANADLVEKKLQLEDPHFSLIEKLLMISDNIEAPQLGPEIRPTIPSSSIERIWRGLESRCVIGIGKALIPQRIRLSEYTFPLELWFKCSWHCFYLYFLILSCNFFCVWLFYLIEMKWELCIINKVFFILCEFDF